MIAQPFEDDYQISYLPGTVQIRVHARPSVKELAKLVVWLFCWLLLFVIVLGMLYAFVRDLFAGETFEVIFLLLFIAISIAVIGMGFSGFVGWRVFLRQIAGQEIIKADSTTLGIQKTVLGIGRTRVYPREQIKAIALAAPEKFPLAISRFNQWRYEVEATGPLYVQFGESKRDFFGFGLDLKQANIIATILKQRLKL